ncbi:MAG: hypothetical protein RLZZ182_1766, partial [Pseudomonadota bacterium]
MRPADTAFSLLIRWRAASRSLATACAAAVFFAAGSAWAAGPTPGGAPCAAPVYLTFDTGHMGVAPLIDRVLDQEQVKATFFLANEPTQPVDGRPAGQTLDDAWAPWWKALSRKGHDFGAHTWDHGLYRGEKSGPTGLQFKLVPTAGPRPGQPVWMDAQAYCAELARPARRFEQMTGQRMRAIFRAPGGKTSPALLAAAQQCGWHHVPWTDAGFLGDELPSDRYPNAQLLRQALARVKAGDILLAHLGIWSRQDAWAPAVLQPLIQGLKAKGL